MKKSVANKLGVLLVLFFVILGFKKYSLKIYSAPVNSLKDQLSSAQLSFFGRLANGNSAGTIIKIGTNGTIPSLTTENLFPGDTIAIAASTGSNIYTVKDIGNTASIELGTTIGVGNTIGGGYVVATRSAIHTITFTPQAVTPGEKWKVLLKASDIGESINDGMPDQGGFDLGADVGSTTVGLGTRLKTADITCPGGGTASIGTTTISGLATANNGNYIYIQCAYPAGSNSTAGVSTTITIGRALTSGSQLINPAPAPSHVPGSATGSVDVYNFILQQLDSSDTILESSFGKIAVTENVRVTAVVDPTITFTIDNTGVTTPGTNLCGSPIGAGAANVTATSVPFGPLSLSTYNNLAQRFSCVTNSTGGYVVQAFENKPLTIVGNGTTIPNTNCQGGSCTTASAGAWTSFTNSGFGYSLAVGTTFSGTTFGIATTGQYKPFGIGFANAQPLMTRTTIPAGTDSAYICYRVTASTTQPAGSYENSISFIATATF